MGLQDSAVGEVQPGEQDQLVAGPEAMECVDEAWVDLEQRVGCALERLVGRFDGRAQRRRTTPIGCTTYGSSPSIRRYESPTRRYPGSDRLVSPFDFGVNG